MLPRQVPPVSGEGRESHLSVYPQTEDQAGINLSLKLTRFLPFCILCTQSPALGHSCRGRRGQTSFVELEQLCHFCTSAALWLYRVSAHSKSQLPFSANGALGHDAVPYILPVPASSEVPNTLESSVSPPPQTYHPCILWLEGLSAAKDQGSIWRVLAQSMSFPCQLDIRAR